MSEHRRPSRAKGSVDYSDCFIQRSATAKRSADNAGRSGASRQPASSKEQTKSSRSQGGAGSKVSSEAALADRKATGPKPAGKRALGSSGSADGSGSRAEGAGTAAESSQQRQPAIKQKRKGRDPCATSGAPGSPARKRAFSAPVCSTVAKSAIRSSSRAATVIKSNGQKSEAIQRLQASPCHAMHCIVDCGMQSNATMWPALSTDSSTESSRPLNT